MESKEAKGTAKVAALRLLLLPILIVTMLRPVAAQTDPTSTAQSGFIATVIAREDPAVCDTVGWAFLPDEMYQNTIDIARTGACHHGVGAIMFGACVDPFRHSDGIIGPEPGQAEVFCRILVQSVEDLTVTVDPQDFFIVDDEGLRYPVDDTLLEIMPEEHKLHLTEVSPGGASTGRLPFTTPEELPNPFILLWWPSTPPDQIPLGIVIDRTVPWSDVEQL